MRINTKPYEEGHGHTPKPDETGTWFFVLNREPGIILGFTTGTYASASKEAQVRAVMKGATAIALMPVN